MIFHELKTWPAYFRPIWDGEKTFEIRYDDRGYQRGDVVNLREWDRGATCGCTGSNHLSDCGRFTGRRVVAEIGFVTASTAPRGQQPGFQGRGYVVFSLINVDRVDEGTHADDAADSHAAVPSPAVLARQVPQQRAP